MSLSKTETDNIILSEAQIADKTKEDFYQQLMFRNTSNSHPLGCSCDLCKILKFSDAGPQQENKTRNELNWFNS